MLYFQPSRSLTRQQQQLFFFSFLFHVSSDDSFIIFNTVWNFRKIQKKNEQNSRQKNIRFLYLSQRNTVRAETFLICIFIMCARVLVLLKVEWQCIYRLRDGDQVHETFTWHGISLRYTIWIDKIYHESLQHDMMHILS